MEPKWNAKFETNSREGREVRIGRTFDWDGCNWHVPAVYLCDEGLIVDYCIETDRERFRAFLDKWRSLFNMERNGGKIANRDICRFESENPLNRFFRTEAWVGEQKLRYKGGNGMQWVPDDLSPIMRDAIDIQPFMRHYSLDPQKVWQFRREKFLWVGGPADLESLKVTLIQDPRMFPGKEFPMPKEGKQITVPNPLTGQDHILTVKEIQAEQVSIPERFAQYEMPAQATVMVYTLEPDLPRERFQLRDTQEADQARKKDGTPYNAGSVGMMLRLPRDGSHAAVSSMRFEAPAQVTWEPVFKAKTVEDLTVTLL